MKHEKPDRLPWLADFDYLISSWKTDGIYPAKYENRYGDEGLQRMHRDFGAGFYLQGYEPFTAVRSGVDIQTQKCGDVTVTTGALLYPKKSADGIGGIAGRCGKCDIYEDG